jgi:hypothetical protein
VINSALTLSHCYCCYCYCYSCCIFTVNSLLHSGTSSVYSASDDAQLLEWNWKGGASHALQRSYTGLFIHSYTVLQYTACVLPLTMFICVRTSIYNNCAYMCSYKDCLCARTFFYAPHTPYHAVIGFAILIAILIAISHVYFNHISSAAVAGFTELISLFIA